jgi:hypothetical protein
MFGIARALRAIMRKRHPTIPQAEPATGTGAPDDIQEIDPIALSAVVGGITKTQEGPKIPSKTKKKKNLVDNVVDTAKGVWNDPRVQTGKRIVQEGSRLLGKMNYAGLVPPIGMLHALSHMKRIEA